MTAKRKPSIFDVFDKYFKSLEEWFEDLRESLEKPSWNQRSCVIEPLRDVTVTSKEVIVTVDLPYTEENMIKVKPIGKNTIEISAKMKRKIRFDDFGITHHKGEFQTLHCQMPIPVPVNMDKMEIRFKRGILEIRLPRKYEYRIPIE
jgi:HSP20 family molecular chaperone IbpA